MVEGGGALAERSMADDHRAGTGSGVGSERGGERLRLSEVVPDERTGAALAALVVVVRAQGIEPPADIRHAAPGGEALKPPRPASGTAAPGRRQRGDEAPLSQREVVLADRGDARAGE